MEIKHVFFDLDRTLWDFEKNSHDELTHLFEKYQLQQKGISLADEFIKVYKQINEECWARYRRNELSKEKLRSERFYNTLVYFGIEDDELAKKFGDDYVNNSPMRTALFPNTFELLDYLHSKYELHIITNGFEEVQHIKLRESKLDKYFNEIITSEKVGVKKPHPDVFRFSTNAAGVLPKESVMIGDDLAVDIVGALDFGMQAIYFNPHNVQHEVPVLADVQELLEIKNVL